MSIYDGLELVALDGSPLDNETLEGHPVLFVNVASKCGFTPQYKDLQKLWEERKDDGLVVVGVPCNQFGGQEPGTATEIETFCATNYGVDFPLLAKQEVNGPGRSPLYERLVGSEAGGGEDISWNFEKFVVDPKGEVVARFPSKVKPRAPELEETLDQVIEK